MNFEVNITGIDEAITKIVNYRKDMIQKAEKLRKMIAGEMKNQASALFSVCTIDDIYEGKGSRVTHMRPATVDVSTRDDGGLSIVIARGDDAVFVEFGAGVYHNRGVVHPNASELGFAIGSYGQGKGKNDTWGFIEDGELMLTHGTPAQMPMYQAKMQAIRKLAEMAKEAFS